MIGIDAYHVVTWRNGLCILYRGTRKHNITSSMYIYIYNFK